jgi:hypothetical protein
MDKRTVHSVVFHIDLGDSIEGTLPEDMEIRTNKVQMSFGVSEKDMTVFTKVLRDNGIPHHIVPQGAISMKPTETQIVYMEDDEDGGDDYDEDEFTD